MPGEVDKLNDTLTNIQISIAEIKTMLSSQQAAKEDHENRIRKVERLVWIAAGLGAAAGNADTVIKLIGG